jgi:hypothetical protein
MALWYMVDEIVSWIVDRSTALVCSHWNRIWHQKPLVAYLLSKEPFDLTTFPNITGLCTVGIVKLTPSIDKLVNLRFLSDCGGAGLTDDILSQLTNLTSINSLCYTITDMSMKRLINLRSLNVYCNRNITDKSVEKLTGLTLLDLRNNCTITSESVRKLTNLTYLNLRPHSIIAPDIGFFLPNLVEFGFGRIFTDRDPYECLSQTKKLIIGNNLPNRDLIKLTQLTELQLHVHNQPHDIIYTLMQLTNLVSLTVSGCRLPGTTRIETLRDGWTTPWHYYKPLPKLTKLVDHHNAYL